MLKAALFVLLLMTAVAAVSQVSFPSGGAVAGNDPPLNPTYTCPYNGAPDTCMFAWDNHGGGVSRVMIAVTPGPDNAPYRWIDDPNPTNSTHHQVVVNHLKPTNTYPIMLANCTGTYTMADCNQYSTNWSTWNCCVPGATVGNVSIPAPQVSASPQWEAYFIGNPSTYVGMWTEMAVPYIVEQTTADAANISGYVTLAMAPVAADGTIGTYTPCTPPTVTTGTEQPVGPAGSVGIGPGPSSGLYKSGGSCGSNINAFIVDGGTTSGNNWPTPWKYSTVDTFRSDDPAILGQKTWGGGIPPPTLAAVTTSTFVNNNNANFNKQVTNVVFMPQAGAVPGKYSLQLTTTLYYMKAICAVATAPNHSCKTQYASGNSVTVAYTFQVLPTPAQITPPSYSSLTQPSTSMSSYKNLYQHSMAFDLAKECSDFRTWNNFGGWNNVGLGVSYLAVYPAPYAIQMYDGSRNRLQIHDYLRDNITADWQANTTYAWGDIILHAGTYYATGTGVPPVGSSGSGLSGPNPPTWNPALTASTIDGANTWVSMGTLTDWYNCSYQIEQQYDNWMLTTTATQEPNEYTQGRVMHFYRQGDRNPQQCLSSGPCVGVLSAGLKRLSDPQPNGIGQASFIFGQTTPWATVRPGPYGLMSVTAEWLTSHQKPVLMDSMLSNTIAQIEYLSHYTPYDAGAVNTLGFPPGPFIVACCVYLPIFDYGLANEALIQADLAYLTEAGAMNPAIHDVVRRAAEDQWKRYNQAQHGFLYSPYFVYPTGAIPPIQAVLNNLSTSAFAWLWRMEGNSCTLPNYTGTTDSCAFAVDTAANDNIQLVVLGGSNATCGQGISKTNSQIYKWWDWWGWRNGTLDALDSYIMPDKNPQEPMFADTLGPYHNAQGKAQVPWPSATVNADNSVSFRWYTYEKLVDVAVGISQYYNNQGGINGANGPVVDWSHGPVTPSNPPTMYDPCPGGASTYDGAKALNAWRNTCTVSGLSNGKYYWGPQGTDAAGNVAKASFQPATTLLGTNYVLPWWVGVNATVCSGFGPCDACSWSTGPPAGCTIPWASFTIPYTAPSPVYTVSGAVSGPASASTSLEIDGTIVSTTTSSGTAGNYTFTGIPNGFYVITPSAPNYSFTPSSVGGIQVNNANLGPAAIYNFVSALASTSTGNGLVTPRIGPGP